MFFRVQFTPVLCTLCVAIIFGHFKGLESAPVSIEKELRAQRDEALPEPITVVFLNSCIGVGKQEVQIEKGMSGDCININVASVENLITTDPEGTRLRLFEKQYCDGSSTLFDPKDSTSQKNNPVQFKVASFIVVRNEEEGMNK